MLLCFEYYIIAFSHYSHLKPFQKIITDFVTIEMSFHAKALEVYSQCFQSLNKISIDTDVKVSDDTISLSLLS